MDTEEPALVFSTSGKSKSKSYNEKLTPLLEKVAEEESEEEKIEEKTIFDRESVYGKSSWM